MPSALLKEPRKKRGYARVKNVTKMRIGKALVIRASGRAKIISNVI